MDFKSNKTFNIISISCVVCLLIATGVTLNYFKPSEPPVDTVESKPLLNAYNLNIQKTLFAIQVNKILLLIDKKISSEWVQPANTPKDLKCSMEVVLQRDGVVLEAKMTGSSGNKDFDIAMDNAVRNSSPWPVPADQELFDSAFKRVNITFSPN